MGRGIGGTGREGDGTCGVKGGGMSMGELMGRKRGAASLPERKAFFLFVLFCFSGGRRG